MKLSQQETSLLIQMEDFNNDRLNAGYGKIPTTIDEDTLKAVTTILGVGTSMRDERGNVRPFFIPPPIALAIYRALRAVPEK